MTTSTTPESDVPYTVDDPINKRILCVSEDKIQGFVDKPFHVIAQQAELNLDVVIQRLRAMLQWGTIRRIRQTLLSTSLSPGALVAWEIDNEPLNDAFEYMSSFNLCKINLFTLFDFGTIAAGLLMTKKL